MIEWKNDLFKTKFLIYRINFLSESILTKGQKKGRLIVWIYNLLQRNRSLVLSTLCLISRHFVVLKNLFRSSIKTEKMLWGTTWRSILLPPKLRAKYKSFISTNLDPSRRVDISIHDDRELTLRQNRL